MEIVFRSFEKLLRFLGLKSLAWDISHSRGTWNVEKKSPILLRLVKEYSSCGRIVEFGCGDGSLVSHLKEGSRYSYLGTDISSVAIRKCQERYSSDSVEFSCRSMEDWEGENGTIDVILCEECIYYLSIEEISTFLSVASRSLKDTGVVIIVCHSMEKHKEIIKYITMSYFLKDQISNKSRIYLVIQPQKTALMKSDSFELRKSKNEGFE